MKRVLTNSILLILLFSCNDLEKIAKSKITETENKTSIHNNFTPNLDVLVTNKTFVKTLNIDGINLSYNPLSLIHEVNEEKVIFKSCDGNIVSVVSVVELDNASIVDESGANPIVSIFGIDKKLEIEVYDIDKAMDILRHNLHDSYASNDKRIEDSIITITKEPKSKDLKNYVQPLYEAPAQNLVASHVIKEIKQIGSSEFWFSSELKMVKSLKRTTLSQAKFSVVDSIDLNNVIVSNFNVSFSIESLDDNFDKIEVKVTNDIDKGAFVTSNPITALGYKCNGKVPNKHIRGERIENGVRYQLAYKSEYLEKCLSDFSSGKIYIYDSKLNKLEKKF